MADKTWILASGSGSWDTGANWDTGTAPSGADRAIFDGRFNGNVSGGTAVANPSSAGGALIVGDKYTGAIGASGSRFNVNVGDGGSLIKSAGQVWLGGTHNNLRVRKPNRAVFNFGGVISTQMFITRGVVTFASGATVPVTIVGYLSTPNSDVSLTVEATVTMTDLFAVGGVISSQSPWSGKVDLAQANVTFQEGAFTASEIEIAGGLCRFNTTGTVAKVKVRGGLFDMSGDGRPKTVTELMVWTAGIANVDNGSNNITLTKAFLVGQGTIIGFGSQLSTTIPV